MLLIRKGINLGNHRISIYSSLGTYIEKLLEYGLPSSTIFLAMMTMNGSVLYIYICKHTKDISRKCIHTLN